MFEPFAALEQSTNIGGLTITSDESRISIHGDFDIHQDQISLQQALKLRDIFAAVVTRLENSNLPENAEACDPDAIQIVDNPFFTKG